MIGGVILDGPALVDFAARRSLYTRSFVTLAERSGQLVIGVAVSAGVEAMSQLDGEGQEELENLFTLSSVVLYSLDPVVRGVGETLERYKGTGPRPDVCDAHVVYLAQQRRWPIVTDDPEPLLALDPGLEIDLLP